MSDTVWMKLECGGGARWISTTEDSVGEVCNFLGCNCGTTVRKVGTTKSRGEAFYWFRRPPGHIIKWYYHGCGRYSSQDDGTIDIVIAVPAALLLEGLEVLNDFVQDAIDAIVPVNATDSMLSDITYTVVGSAPEDNDQNVKGVVFLRVEASI